jgi:hypothetical protein
MTELTTMHIVTLLGVLRRGREMKQKELNGKVFAMLISATTTMKALEGLRLLVVKCIGKPNQGNGGSLFVSLSAMEIEGGFCVHPLLPKTAVPIVLPLDLE